MTYIYKLNCNKKCILYFKKIYPNIHLFHAFDIKVYLYNITSHSTVPTNTDKPVWMGYKNVKLKMF